MNRDKSQLNLATLRRIDPATIDVLGNSAHVAVYKFVDQSKSWQKREIEGSLFVIKRSEFPNYRIVVLNRLSTENLTEDVTSNLLVQLSGPYMIYRNQHGVTTGIWFYEENEKETISNLLNSIIREEVARISVADNNNVAALAGILTSIKEQAAAAAQAPTPYTQPNYPSELYNQALPPSPYPPSQSPYPPPFLNPLPPQHYQNGPPQNYQNAPPPQIYQNAPPQNYQAPPSHPPHPFPPQQQSFDHPPPGYAHPPPTPSNMQPLPTPPPSSSQLPPGNVIANLISSLANQHLPPNLSHSNSLPNMYPPGHPTNNTNYNAPAANQNPNSPKAPPKAFAYDADSPFPKLLSPSNLAAKSLLQQQPPPSLALNTSLPLVNPSAGLPPGRASPSPSLPPPNLNGSVGSSDGRGGLGGSSERLGGSGGVPRLSKQQLRQGLLNLVHDDRFLDLVYNEYVAQQR